MARKDYTPGDDRSVIPTAGGVSPSILGTPERIYLSPGEFHVSLVPIQITTILGSCVAICLWDSQNHAGGMNHYLFPEWHEGDGGSTRFGNLASLNLLASLFGLGCEAKNMTAKVFGGAALFTAANRYSASLGARNVEVAHCMMADAGIPIVAEDIGGQYGRKVIFNTGDCSVLLRKL